MADENKQDDVEGTTSDVDKTEVKAAETTTEKVEDKADEKVEDKADEKAEKADDKAEKKAEKVEKKAEKAAAVVKAPKPKRTVKLPIFIVVAVACLAAGVALGYFVLTGLLAGGTVAGKTTVSEDQLDATLGSYTYDGQTTNVTVREAIEADSTLDSAKQDDGTYTVPSADTVVSIARNAIVQKQVTAEGITVSDDDVSSYAESSLGSSDYATIASQYGMTEDAVKETLTESCGTKKLYDSVVTTTTTSAPTAPTSPADGTDNDTMTADYGAYVVGLLGDEWDSTTNTWARTDGSFYSAMKDMQFTSDSASYTQAETAYYVAYQQYSQTASDASSQWTSYVNGLLSKATISLSTLVS